MTTENTYTHVYTVDTIGTEAFMVHEDRFDEFVDELVKQCGEEYRHRLDAMDQAGNPWYVSIEAFVDVSDMPETIELEFDKDGVSANTPHTWRVNYGIFGWPESITYEAEKKQLDGFTETFKDNPDEWLSLSFEKFKAVIEAVNSKELPKSELRSRFYGDWEVWRVEQLLDEAYQLVVGSEINIAIGDESRQDGVVIDADDVQIIVLGEDEFVYRLRTHTANTDWETGNADDVINFAVNVTANIFYEKLFPSMR